MDALGLMAVLIELIAQHGNGDRQRADHGIKHIRAGHGGFLSGAIACQRVKLSSSVDSCRRLNNPRKYIPALQDSDSKRGEGELPIPLTRARPLPDGERGVFLFIASRGGKPCARGRGNK